MDIQLVKVKGKDIGNLRGISGNLDNFNPAIRFKHHDRYELYEDEHEYEYDDNNEIIKKYIISDWRDGELKKQLIYVLVQKIWRPTDTEIKLYEKHCQCSVCTASILNPMRYFMPRCYTGCIWARDFNDDLEIRALTLKYLQDKKLL